MKSTDKHLTFTPPPPPLCLHMLLPLPQECLPSSFPFLLLLGRRRRLVDFCACHCPIHRHWWIVLSLTQPPPVFTPTPTDTACHATLALDAPLHSFVSDGRRRSRRRVVSLPLVRRWWWWWRCGLNKWLFFVAHFHFSYHQPPSATQSSHPRQWQ